MTPKIDLAEIEKIQLEFSRDVVAYQNSGDDMDGVSWVMQEGVLISANTAKQIASALEALPKLVEALRVTQQKMDDCDGNNFAWLFRTDYYECLLSEALTLFETTNPAKP